LATSPGDEIDRHRFVDHGVDVPLETSEPLNAEAHDGFIAGIHDATDHGNRPILSLSPAGTTVISFSH
jgi:hypothetical protein